MEMRSLARYLLLATFNLAALAFACWTITDLRWEWLSPSTLRFEELRPWHIAWLLLWLPWMLACNLTLRRAI
jgi:hypothetical protein